MESLNKIKNKRKLKFSDHQNYNKRRKTQFQKDNEIIKYIIKCTKNNTKLLEDLKYIYKSNEISDFSKRLKKYIAKREKIEREINHENTIEKIEKKKETLLDNTNNDNKKGKEYREEKQNNILENERDGPTNYNNNSINFVFTDRRKNIKEILIIKPINEVKEIKYNYCQLDTTNRYIIKRIKKDNFVEAYNSDLDFKNFLNENHQLFENNCNNVSNEEIAENKGENTQYSEKENLNIPENKVLVERHENQYKNDKESNDNIKRNAQTDSENIGNKKKNYYNNI